jgi:RNA polymerase sigma-70 factor, ECF subfamily
VGGRHSSAADRSGAEQFRWIGIFQEEVDYVYWTLRRFGARPGDAEDLAQEVFLTMWRRRETYDPQRPLRPWIAGIAFRVKQAHRRRGGRELPIGFVDEVDQAPLPDERLEAERTQVLVVAALARVPERQRSVLVLHDIDGLPMREISEVMSVPLFTLYSRLRTARRAFARELRRAQRLAPSPLDAASAEALLAGARKAARAPARTRRRVTARLPALLASADQPGPPPAPLPGPPVGAIAAVGVALALASLFLVARPRAAVVAAGAIDRGLVAYWRFDEAGGLVARDLTGGGNDCRLRRLDPGAARIGGRLGTAIALDGHGWLECAPTPSLSRIADEITIAAFVTKGTVLPRYHSVVARQKGIGRLDEFMFGFADGELVFTSHLWRAKVIARLPAALGRWFHVAATRHRDGTVLLFVDGREVGRGHTLAAVLDTSANPLIVGAARNSDEPNRTEAHFDGGVDELVIYDRALSAGEIARLARGAQPLSR